MANRFSSISTCLWTIYWITPPALIKTGMSNRPMRNALVRTAAWYSRAAITKTLFMIILLGLGVRDADENIVQGWLGQLEMLHPAPVDQGRQHLLRVGATVEAQLLEPAEVGDLHHPGQVVQGVPVAVQPDVH